MKTHLNKSKDKNYLSDYTKSDSTHGNSFIQDNRSNAVYQRKLIDTFQRKRKSEPVADLRTIRSNTSVLPDKLKSGIENLSGYTMDDVKVHYNSPKPAQLRAHAYAQGTDIHLGPGQEKHLPHEAWHVVQQKQGRVKPTMQFWKRSGNPDHVNASEKKGVQINDDAGLEREADVMGTKATQLMRNANFVNQNSLINKSVNTSSIQRKKGDYKDLWEKDEEKARNIIRKSWGEYLTQTEEFEERLGIALFNDVRAERGADLFIEKIDEKYNENGSNLIYYSDQQKSEAGSIANKNIGLRKKQGNLREKMFMVYTAIASGKLAYEVAKAEEGHVIPVIVDEGEERVDYMCLKKNVLKRRKSTVEQDRKSNKMADAPENYMTAKELEDRRIGLSPFEKALRGKEDKAFIKGQHFYIIDEENDKLYDDRRNEKVTFANYKMERLTPFKGGMSGTTDGYFRVAEILGISKANKELIRLAALGQMLTNNDHSYHEIMHKAKTKGGLDDYQDELPIGYTTLSPIPENEILVLAGFDQFPGDSIIEEHLTNYE